MLISLPPDYRPSDDEEFMNPMQIEYFRQKLLRWRGDLVKDDDLDWFDLIGTEWKKVAMGNPDLTASGRVAQRALGQMRGFDHAVRRHAVRAHVQVARMQQDQWGLPGVNELATIPASGPARPASTAKGRCARWCRRRPR